VPGYRNRGTAEAPRPPPAPADAEKPAAERETPVVVNVNAPACAMPAEDLQKFNDKLDMMHRMICDLANHVMSIEETLLRHCQQLQILNQAPQTPPTTTWAGAAVMGTGL